MSRGRDAVIGPVGAVGAAGVVDLVDAAVDVVGVDPVEVVVGVHLGEGSLAPTVCEVQWWYIGVCVLLLLL